MHAGLGHCQHTHLLGCLRDLIQCHAVHLDRRAVLFLLKIDVAHVDTQAAGLGVLDLACLGVLGLQNGCKGVEGCAWVCTVCTKGMCWLLPIKPSHLAVPFTSIARPPGKTLSMLRTRHPQTQEPSCMRDVCSNCSCLCRGPSNHQPSPNHQPTRTPVNWSNASL